MIARAFVLAALAGMAYAGAIAVAQDKVPVVAVAGCLAEKGGTWMLTDATEPVPSIANAPSASQPYTGPRNGAQQFRLIGISEFDLPSHKGANVLVKALFIKADPVSRLNVTSITRLGPACPAPAK